MSNLKERLDHLREEIQKDDFLDGKGLSNEVNIRIFCYDPAEEMTVTHFLDQIKIDQSLNCRLIECNLYKTFLSICDDLDITDAIPEMEEADGGLFCGLFSSLIASGLRHQGLYCRNTLMTCSSLTIAIQAPPYR